MSVTEVTAAEIEKLDNLWSQAESAFLDRNDFDPLDWLDDDDLETFKKLRNKIDGAEYEL